MAWVFITDFSTSPRKAELINYHFAVNPQLEASTIMNFDWYYASVSGVKQ